MSGNWFYSCHPCAIEGSCFDGCGVTWWGIIVTITLSSLVIVFSGVIINKIYGIRENYKKRSLTNEEVELIYNDGVPLISKKDLEEEE